MLDVDRHRALRETLGPDRLDTLLGLLRVELEMRPAQMRRAGANDDLRRLAAEAHGLKGAAASAGAPAVADLAGRIEKAAEQGEVAGDALDRLERSARATLDLLSSPTPAHPVAKRA